MKDLVTVQGKAISPVKSLNKYITEFIKSQDVADSSRATYHRTIKQFTEWLSSTGRVNNLSSLSRVDILTFKQDLLDQGKAPTTVNGYLTSVRKFFEWLETEKIFPNIAKGIKGSKKSRNFKKDCLTPSQIRQALASIDTNTTEGKRGLKEECMVFVSTDFSVKRLALLLLPVVLRFLRY